ncbi:MAG: hypothetical protein U9R72_11445 [Chloroflexota bacterium]|nr:hypothetical protein [Chloroflexota bacterium]
MNQDTADRIAELERRIADLEARLPKHSVPPRMLIELEELEEALEKARSEAAGEDQR